MQSVNDPAAATPRQGDFLAANRGGGLYSEAVSQRIGSVLALTASRLGLPPTVLSLANLVLGVGASVVVVVLAPRAASGSVPAWAVGLGALLAWQIAYALDCADGQLARVTGQASPAGARLDILCDVAVQIALVCALSAVSESYRPATPAWLIGAFVGTWMVNLVASVMQSGPTPASMVPSRALPVRLVKLIRDYGAVILVAGLVLTFVPRWTVAVLWLFTAVNGVFLFASIAYSARHSLRHSTQRRS